MTSPGFLGFGPFRVHPTQGLFRGDRELHVTPKSLALLYELASHSQEVRSKTDLFDAVWPGRVVTDAALSSCVHELRQALGDDAREPRFLETLHGRGMRLLEAARLESQADKPTTLGPSSRPSVAVLPFDPISSDEASAVLARGLTHDVITCIARTRTTLVIARGTAFRYAATGEDVQRVGQELGVRYIVQGAVQLRDRRLALTATLVDAKSREELWSERHVRQVDDWMILQQELAEQVVASIEHEVERREMDRSLLMPSNDLDAWSAYHRGLSHLYRYRRSQWDRAEHWFLKSIEMEPNLPRPHAGLSLLNFERAFLNPDRDRQRQVDLALRHAEDAVVHDDHDPMAHCALSRAHLLRGEMDSARQAMDTARTLNPSYANAQYTRGWIALQMGDNELCDERIDLAMRLSPFDPLAFAMKSVSGLNLALMGRDQEALARAQDAANRVDAHYLISSWAALTFAICGHATEGSAFLAQTRRTRPGFGAEEFFHIFRFQKDEDRRRIQQAFDAIG